MSEMISATRPLVIKDGDDRWELYVEDKELRVRFVSFTAKSAIAAIGDSSNTLKLRPVEYFER